MEGMPIASKVLGADPSQNLGATFFGALSESMPRIQELAGEINDLPIAEQELALETELAKLELSDKDGFQDIKLKVLEFFIFKR